MTKLFVICGHGAGDPGATGFGYNEAERVRTLAKYIQKHGGNDVEIGDTTKNWYRQDIIDNYNFEKGVQILELHMDSGNPSARGGHVLIDDEAGQPDKYDKALANFLGKVFPGRSEKIVYRSDLENPDDAVRRGLNYRLLEVCFITNLEDLKVFNGSLDFIAQEILKCFGITKANQQKTSASTRIKHSNGSDAQKWKLEKQGEAYRLKNKATGFYLASRDDKAEHGNPVMAGANISQAWKLTQAEEGINTYFYISCEKAPNFNLACYKAGTTDGTGTVIGKADQAYAQRWSLIPTEDGYHYIVSAKSGLALSTV